MSVVVSVVVNVVVNGADKVFFYFVVNTVPMMLSLMLLSMRYVALNRCP